MSSNITAIAAYSSCLARALIAGLHYRLPGSLPPSLPVVDNVQCGVRSVTEAVSSGDLKASVAIAKRLATLDELIKSHAVNVQQARGLSIVLCFYPRRSDLNS